MIEFTVHYKYETRLIAGDGTFTGVLAERGDSGDFDIGNFCNKLRDAGFTVTRVDRSDETQDDPNEQQPV